MVEETLEIFCRLKTYLGVVKKENLLEAGVDAGKLDLLVKNKLLEESKGVLELTSKGDAVLLNHREEFLHDRLLHRGEEKRPPDAVDHWMSCHHIDRATLKEFYDRLKTMPYRIEELVPLLDLSVGRTGEVVLVVGGRGLIGRLCDLGLTPGTAVKVLRRAPAGGPIELEVRSTAIAVGRGIASKVLVRPKIS
jgi:Fe2+ transport system protein FeoA